MALAEVFESFVGPDAPVEFTAYDGSHAGRETDVGLLKKGLEASQFEAFKTHLPSPPPHHIQPS